MPFLLVLIVVAVAAATHRGQSAHRPSGAQAAPAGRPGTSARTAPPPSSTLARMLGQMVVARFAGTTPSGSVLARIRAGEVGGAILFADNVAGGLAEARATLAELQSAARQGGNPQLLVMADQEGGEVSRLPGPPTLAPSAMTSPPIAFAQGRATGRLLRAAGVNVDLAPVADVEHAPGSFLGTRSFGSTPGVVAMDACAFARGVASEGVAYTLKHFPGLGRATQSTDRAPVTIGAAPAVLRSDYAPYAACGHDPLAIVMISNAIYPSLTGPLPAAMSPLTYQRELPLATAGAPVVTISDDLQAGALTDQQGPAAHAVDAGLDLLLYARTEQASAGAYGLLLKEAQAGSLTEPRIRAAYAAIVELKRRLARAASG